MVSIFHIFSVLVRTAFGTYKLEFSAFSTPSDMQVTKGSNLPLDLYLIQTVWRSKASKQDL